MPDIVSEFRLQTHATKRATARVTAVPMFD